MIVFPCQGPVFCHAVIFFPPTLCHAEKWQRWARIGFNRLGLEELMEAKLNARFCKSQVVYESFVFASGQPYDSNLYDSNL